MSCVQQKMVVRNADFSGLCFLGRPVYTSEEFCYFAPKRFYKRAKNKRLFHKWCNRYGVVVTPRTDADIYHYSILCHTGTLCRFEDLGEKNCMLGEGSEG